ncbi:FXYD domain-containing ion transport regulator 11 [Neoarius graeffei]|uniref:FXYD domain-containing ion transport regulator 11 n=1 Tax=Neoarius graeffei TaxID=443677 RepID=UPI00298C1C8D|nr:FXYD domain-containing ion transport regulator 11 [Neoarius graeffei]
MYTIRRSFSSRSNERQICRCALPGCRIQHISTHTVHLNDIISCGTRRQEAGKMSRFALLVLLTVLIELFSRAEADPFVYNYDRLKIGGIVFTVLLIVGAIVFLFYDKCSTNKKRDDAADQI